MKKYLSRSHLPILVFLMVTLVGCVVTEPQIIIQTKVLQRPGHREIVTREVTRIVKEVVIVTLSPPTPTPTPTPPPPLVRLYFAPASNPEDDDLPAYHRLAELLAERTGYTVSASVPASYHDSIEALCNGQADIAWLATPAYIIANDACGAEARFSVIRNGYAFHVAQIMVQADKLRAAREVAAVDALKDLNDQAFGFTLPNSTTGYLFPKAMLIDSTVVPSQEVFLGGDAQAVLAVYKGEVDAAAAYWAPIRSDGSVGDARAMLLDAYPDVVQVVKILRLSDPIPNDPVVFAGHVPPDVQDKLVVAMIDLAKSDEGSELFYELYHITGLAPADDSDYAIVRQMGDTLHLSFAQILERSSF